MIASPHGLILVGGDNRSFRFTSIHRHAHLLQDFIEMSALSLLGVHLFAEGLRCWTIVFTFSRKSLRGTTVEVSSVHSFFLLGMPLLI